MMINQLSSQLPKQDQQHFKLVALTIHSAFLLHNNFKSKPSWGKRSQMQLKLEHMMLSITDEISMVGFNSLRTLLCRCNMMQYEHTVPCHVAAT